MQTAVLALTSISLSALAQLILKLGMLKATSSHRHSSFSLRETLWLAACSPTVWTGLLVYAASAVVWVAVLSRLELSVAYPLVAFGIVLTSILGWIVLSEPMGAVRVLGIALVTVGVILVGLTGRFGQ